MRVATRHGIFFGNFGVLSAGRSASVEQMHVAGFFCAGLAGKNFGEWRIAAHEQAQRGVDGFEVFERIQTIGAGAEFAGGLRAAEEQDAKDSQFIAMKIVEFVDAVFVFGDAGIAACGADQGLFGKSANCLTDGNFVEGGDWIAIGFLVTGVEESVQRERVIFRSGAFFFDERAEDADFRFRELKGHEGRISAPSRQSKAPQTLYTSGASGDQGTLRGTERVPMLSLRLSRTAKVKR